MADSVTLPLALRDEIVALLEPLVAAARQPFGVQLLMQALGHTDELGARADLRTEIERLAALVQAIADLQPETIDSWSGVAQVLGLADDLFSSARGIERVLQDPALAEQAQDLGRDLAEMLLAMHLRARHPTLFRVASLLTIITPAEQATPQPMVVDGARLVRLGRQADRLQFERVEALLRDPLPTLSEAYFPNRLDSAADAYASASRLFPLLRLLVHSFGLKCFDDRVPVGAAPPPVSPAVNEADHFGDDEHEDGALDVEFPPRQEVDPTPYFEGGQPRLVVVLPGLVNEGVAAPARLAVGARVSSAAHPGAARGLIVELLGQLALDESRGGWHLKLDGEGSVPGIVLGPDGAALAPDAGVLPAAGARLLIEREAVAGAPAFVLGASTGTRLEVGALQIGAEVHTTGTDCKVGFSIDARSGAIVVAPDDGFLGSLVPAQGLRVSFDLGLVWSSLSGFALRGSAGMEATVPVGRSVGPITLSTLQLSLRAGGSGLSASVTGDLAASIGPVRAIVTGLGLAADLGFPAGGGNLGAADLSLGPRFPTGIGLTVDAGVVQGGGLVFHDAAQSLYAGVLQLSVHGTIDVSAFGLIATKLPDGSKGYSLLVFITADGFQPIQLGLGFTLLGIGGMVAVNRSFDEAVLREGLKTDTLGSLLFPRDPVANAPAIIRALVAAFPARSGSYLVGLLVRIGWFTPTLITADLAVIVELGARKRLLMLGRVRALLPSADEALLRITLDAMGVFDFDAGTAAIDAVLVDSRLLERFVITGSAALRARWSRPRSFALSMGGMNPGFTLPADFPALQRLTLSLTTGDNPRLTCDAYFALTSNTVQFGSHAHLYAAAFGFSVTGDAGFDVLITLSPFHFLAEIFAGMQLKRGSSNLFKVKVQGTLEGPAPLTLRAKASFEILWWDVTIRVNATLAEGQAPALPAAVDALAQLRAALGDLRNWHAELPAGSTRAVSLRDAEPGAALRVHPLGTVNVRQAVVPLNLQRDIQRFGEAPVAGSRRFAVSAALIGGQPVERGVIGDDFAPAQFFEMSDDAKLSAPQYESMQAGVAFGAPGSSFDLGAAVASPLDYETQVVDREAAPQEEAPPYRLSDALLELHARHGAAGRSVMRTLAPVVVRPFAALHAPGFAVVDEALVQTGTSTQEQSSLTFAEAAVFATRRVGLRAVPAFQALH